MKQKSFLSTLIIGFTSVILIASCSKEVATTPQIQTQPVFPQTLNLTANHWQEQGDDPVYTNSFNGIMPSGASASQTKVYLVADGNETLISAGSVVYLGGELLATITGTDIILSYHSFSYPSLPFGYLNIKVVFE